MTGSASGSTVGLNLKRPLYLGGVDPAEAISPSVGVVDGFVGCIAEVTAGMLGQSLSCGLLLC